MMSRHLARLQRSFSRQAPDNRQILSHSAEPCRSYDVHSASILRGTAQGKSPRFHSLTLYLVEEPPMNSIIYLVGLIVVVMAILSFVGLR